MLAGGFALLLLGALVNYRWVIDFLHTSDDSFRRFLGMQPMLWGIVDHIFKTDNVSLTIGFICAAAVLALETYLLWKDKPGTEPFEAFTTIVPATLIVAPYLWNYDQILLMIPILYLLIAISKKYGDLKAALFMFGVVALAFGMVMVAYWLQHDVWSFMNTFVIWVLSLYFFTRGRRREDNQAGLAPVAKIV